jgi:TATA-box binding protein (TBP) (component of TFIID and TFIIIB)
VNVVGSGSLGREMNLTALREDMLQHISIQEAKPMKSGLLIKFSETSGTMIVYRSGKYNLMGFSSVDDLQRADVLIRNVLVDIGDKRQKNDEIVSISNFVYTVDFNQRINLLLLESYIGDRAVYEPEQNPFVIYKPEDINGTITLSNSGKCVINTATGEQGVIEIIDHIMSLLENSSLNILLDS